MTARNPAHRSWFVPNCLLTLFAALSQCVVGVGKTLLPFVLQTRWLFSSSAAARSRSCCARCSPLCVDAVDCDALQFQCTVSGWQDAPTVRVFRFGSGCRDRVALCFATAFKSTHGLLHPRKPGLLCLNALRLSLYCEILMQAPIASKATC
jgi:hypothetical protein